MVACTANGAPSQMTRASSIARSSCVPAGTQLDRAIELARVICEGAPLAVQATKASSARYLRDGEDACIAALAGTQAELAATDDAEEGVAAFKERRKGDFVGR